jgi:hypothetical protein
VAAAVDGTGVVPDATTSAFMRAFDPESITTSRGYGFRVRGLSPAPRNDRAEGLPADYTSFTFFSGRLRTGLPVAAKIAFITAGAATQIVGSPTPPQKS